MKILHFIVGLLLSTTAFAQSYPNKPIKFVVPFPPGGNLDFVARTLQPKMQEALGQPVVIDNKGRQRRHDRPGIRLQAAGRRLHHRAW